VAVSIEEADDSASDQSCKTFVESEGRRRELCFRCSSGACAVFTCPRCPRSRLYLCRRCTRFCRCLFCGHPGLDQDLADMTDESSEEPSASSTARAPQGPPPGSPKPSGAAQQIKELVHMHCPRLEENIEAWLGLYGQPELLLESLRREYEAPTAPQPDCADDTCSDDASTCAGSSASASGSSTASSNNSRGAGFAEPSGGRGRAHIGGKLYKVRMCRHFKRHGSCRRGGDCEFAHSLDELNYWQSTRRAAQAPPSRQMLLIMPIDIGFSHDAVSAIFSNGKPILELLKDLCEERLSIRQLPVMKVAIDRGRFFALTNRHLCLFRLCQILGLLGSDTPIKVELVPDLPRNFRYTNCSEGDWVRVRQDGRICGKTSEDTNFGLTEFRDFWPSNVG